MDGYTNIERGKFMNHEFRYQIFQPKIPSTFRPILHYGVVYLKTR